jgi:hypothetical protein
MNTNKANDKTTALAVAITILILLFAFVLYIRPKSPFYNSALQSSQQRRILLLYHSDHEALLMAGREILRQSPDPKNYKPVGRPIHILGFPVPRDVRIPKVVHQLRPHGIYINFGGYLVLQMNEGVTGFGFKIYPEGYNMQLRNFQYGNRELIPGLWYFDDKYSRKPEYDKIIDYIIPKGRWPDPNQTDFSKSSQ